MRFLAAISALLLAGCASFPNLAGPGSYEPYAPEKADPAAYAADLATCRSYALRYRPTVDPAAIASSTASGVLGNLPGALAGPSAPLLGGAGSGGSELVAELGLSSLPARKIVARCMLEKGEASGKYHVLDPIL